MFVFIFSVVFSVSASAAEYISFSSANYALDKDTGSYRNFDSQIVSDVDSDELIIRSDITLDTPLSAYTMHNLSFGIKFVDCNGSLSFEVITYNVNHEEMSTYVASTGYGPWIDGCVVDCKDVIESDDIYYLTIYTTIKNPTWTEVYGE